MDNQPVVFISHAGVDSKYAELLIDLIREIGVARENILCTSVVGYRIEQGKHWNNELRDVFLKRNPYMIFLHSDNFYKSPVCMNELGAAWVLNLNIFSLLVPGFDYENMASVITSTVLSTKIDDPIEVIFEYFCNLKDDLIKRYGIESPKEAVWYRAVNKFQQESLKMAEPILESVLPLFASSHRRESTFFLPFFCLFSYILWAYRKNYAYDDKKEENHGKINYRRKLCIRGR